MLKAVTILLVFQLVGEVTVRALTLPIPGPVVGMLLLFLLLTIRGAPSPSLLRTAHGLLQQLSLLYVPAGVGIMVHFSLIRREWPAILLALVLSTTLTLVLTALTMQWLVARTTPGAVVGRR